MLSRAHIITGLLSALGKNNKFILKTVYKVLNLNFVLLVCSITCDEFRLGTIFSDGMVLQRTANRDREHITEGIQ